MPPIARRRSARCRTVGKCHAEAENGRSAHRGDDTIPSIGGRPVHLLGAFFFEER